MKMKPLEMQSDGYTDIVAEMTEKCLVVTFDPNDFYGKTKHLSRQEAEQLRDYITEWLSGLDT